MNLKLIRYIHEMRSDLLAEAERIKARLQSIDAELTALEKAELAASQVEPIQQVTESKSNTRARKSQIKPGTIMAHVLDTLGAHPDGLVATDILGALNRGPYKEAPIARTSLSPQLSRLRAAGYVKLDRTVWKVSANPESKIGVATETSGVTTPSLGTPSD